MHYTILCKTIFSASLRSSLHVKNQVWDSSSSDYDFQINSWIEKKQTIADYGLEIDLFSIFEPLIAFVTPYLTTSYEYELPLCPRPMLTTTLLLTLICYQSVPADPNIVDGMFLYVGDYHLTLDKIAGLPLSRRNTTQGFYTKHPIATISKSHKITRNMLL